ncbi:putative hydroxypyruvate isomerase isoform X3 [Scaptodrosophila lebanonensis]|uniref:Hydroxypyruvate isomerase isoform X3 n=1 Tax=Drosophila lebanonensis TaxID=7225 RepID=A0A6J2U341_DROLE|nr:putative hydroxypyruvate isomerase isoform X3 [Scaptodrosophila lebanonensis]
MTLRFAANLNFLFGESSTSIAERIRKAHIYGFKAVEIPYPEHEVDDVVKATNETGICVSLINIALDKTRDDLKFGSASIPGEEILFKKQLDKTIEFATLVNCKNVFGH